MRYLRTFVLFALATFPLAGLKTLQHWDNMQTKHSWTTVPSNWESVGYPPASTTIDLYVGLKPHRENALIDVLNEVSDPMHRKYGSYLTKEQVAELVAPHPDTLELVYSWLGHHGVPSSSISVTHGGSSLMLAGVSVSQANNLLGASYQLYNQVKTNETILRTISYSLPMVLHAHVQTVVPTTCFESPLHGSTRRAAASLGKVASGDPTMKLPKRDVSNETTPSFLRWIYRTWGYTPSATYQNALGIVGFVWNYPSPTDLKEFMDTYRYGAEATFTVVQVNGGGYDPRSPHEEANLDIQCAGGIAYPTPLLFYSTGRGLWGQDDWYSSWFKYILNAPTIPLTISISYANPEQDYSSEYILHICTLFAQLAVRGVSVLVASGDKGVGKDCGVSGNVRFVPYFPASCPYVTSVGGTKGAYPEVAAELSGGGFSSYFSRPPYQQQAVSTFLQAIGTQYQGFYNPLGRALPDISAQALDIPIFLNGIEILLSGTSGSAPIVAGIISLLNDYRIAQGRAPLGFLNPWLYTRAIPGLNDVTSGTNPGCNTIGFPAVPGWDPVTGLGTPDFERLQAVLPIT
ncbi:peptidase S8/S53 domain-containing protein [Lactarius quietus]|nr:peptidase S8/S53 domain-containing protein [Lactarius quietus]